MPTIPCPPCCRRGYTLPEMLVSMTLGTVLMAGTASSIYISSQTLQTDATAPAGRNENQVVLAEMTRDVQAAISVSEVSEHALAFSVPDRNNDGLPENIRYAWGGNAGDPLTYEGNGAVPVVLLPNVENFAVTALSRFLEGYLDESLLFVMAGETPTANEATEIAQIEKWGYPVVTVNQKSDESEITKLAVQASVVYVSGETSHLILGTKLNRVAAGIVSAQYPMCLIFGLAANVNAGTAKSITIDDEPHPIIAGFAAGNLEISTSNIELRGVKLPGAPDLLELAERSGNPVLVALDQGSPTLFGEASPGRRVMLPWGGAGFDFMKLTPAGQTLVKQSLDWAAGRDSTSQTQEAASSKKSTSDWFSAFLK